MELITKIIIGVTLACIYISVGAFDLSGPVENSYPGLCEGEPCTLNDGIKKAKNTVAGIETERPLSVYVIDVVLYLLTFLALIGIIIIIYAGFNVLTSGGDEEKAKNSRKIIINVLIGMTIIFLAYPIVLWYEGVLNPTEVVI